MMQPLVVVVVLAHNNYPDTAECLHSLQHLDYTPLRLLVVDNDSTDGTGGRVLAEFPQASLVQTGRNLGVAGGFNAGVIPALQGGADYVCILNNDTTVSPDMMTLLMQAGEADPWAGILMPKVVYYNDPKRIWSAGARYRRFPPAIVMRGLDQPDDGRFDAPALLEFAPTCGLLIRRRVFERVGLFDDGYFFYFDDWDFSLRVRRAGMTISYVPAARLYHKVSRTIQHKGRPPFFWRTWGASGARFYRRFGRPAALSAALHLGYLAFREGLRSDPSAVRYFVQGAIRSWRQPLTPPPVLPAEACRGAASRYRRDWMERNEGVVNECRKN
jgi:GT2 family glycosyltransferase